MAGKVFEYDFGGYATKNNVRCADGRIIRAGAFAEQDGAKIPLVWQHLHNDPKYVIGHAMLENRPDGVYAYCNLNDSAAANDVKRTLKHGDLQALSIWANGLLEKGANVIHGVIREVSVVLSGANPEAKIDDIMHDGFVEEYDEDGELLHSAIITNGYNIDANAWLSHDDVDDDSDDYEEYDEDDHDDDDDVLSEEDAEYDDEEGLIDGMDAEDLAAEIDAMSPQQKNIFYTMVGAAAAQAQAVAHSAFEEELNNMKYNPFDNDTYNEEVISHAEQGEILGDAETYGSAKQAALAHGIENIDYLFPDYKRIGDGLPEYIKRETGWVDTVMNGVHHTPFSRIKTMFADITEDDARALGYIKGNYKKEEVFSLLKRTTSPQTIYKKQRFERDDLLDITDFDVVAWIKTEMRMMLNEEIARAILIGDGRLASSDDKISPDHIRPIATDAALYVISTYIDDITINTNNQQVSVDTTAKKFIRAAVKARKDYKGSGNPRLFTTQDMVADLRLIEDLNMRPMYNSDSELASALRVSGITEVPVMENAKDSSGDYILGIIVNLNDYNIGADKGGAINMFDDFDIDYNRQKYLIETRCSGALIKPYSAIVIKKKAS